MTRLFARLALTLLLSTTAAAAEPVCLDSRNVTDSKVVDTHTVMFRMLDGGKWRGTLDTECRGLTFNGFVLFPANSDRICEGVQLIRAIQNKQVCRIVSLEPMPPRRP
ncbi:MAG: hypothetical protein JOZ55_06535 [Alphaproteobacteria bacterium]|nr:hypothetical protein [Alphaproteobacteria bacterium]